MLRTLGAAAVLAFAASAVLVAWWALRPNRALVDPRLGLVSWDLVADGEHNSNTDLIVWRRRWLLVHAASPYHMGAPRSRLAVRGWTPPAPGAGPDPGARWERVAELRVPGADVRDPIWLERGGRLHLYALSNRGFYAIPSGTVVATSDDGERFTPFEPVGPPGWLFWRIRAHPGERAAAGGPVLYASAYWKDHGESILAVADGALFADYYTSRIDRDPPWLLGMVLRSDIRMARVPLDALHALAAKPGEAP